VLADRVDRTRLVVAMQVVMMAMSVVLAALVAGDSPLWTIFAVQLVIGVANTVNAPAFSASIPMMVPRADLPGAVSLNSAMINGSRIAGPAVAAVLATVGFSVPQLFVVNAATYLFLVVPLLTSVRLPQVAGPDGRRGWSALRVGIDVVRGRGVLVRTISTMFLFSLVCLPFIGLFPSIARLNFGLDPVGGEYKALYIVWGLGAFFGALAVGTWLAHRDTRRLIPFGLILFALCLGVFTMTSNWVVGLPVAAALGFVYFMTATALASVMQRNLADHERASAMPLWFMSFGGTVPVGNLVAGPIMDAYGARWVLGVGAVFAIGLAWWSNLAALDRSDFLSVDDGGEPFVPVNANRLF
jgi:MFS family permease